MGTKENNSVTSNAGLTGQILAIGEAMIEMSRLDLHAGHADIGVAGDTLNTAVYLARLCAGSTAKIAYLTALGQDGLSDAMIDWMEAEGVATHLIGRHPTRLPGLYAIERDAQAERRFRYWRDGSAARTMFADGIGVDAALEGADVIILSGITLAILEPTARAALIAGCRSAREAGKIVAFDSNYRPALWTSPHAARAAFGQMWAACSIALPSAEDEAIQHPQEAQDETIARIADAGAAEIALKRGAAGPLLWYAGATRSGTYPAAARVVDTTAAGDSFNAAYLHARLCGAPPATAAQAGHALACQVVARPGAIVPLADDDRQDA